MKYDRKSSVEHVPKPDVESAESAKIINKLLTFEIYSIAGTSTKWLLRIVNKGAIPWNCTSPGLFKRLD